MSLKYGLIAAGQGSRLVAEGVTDPKPLIKVGGEPLIGRLLRIFQDNGAESISVIINEDMKEVREYLAALKIAVPLHVEVKTTPDSFHSFHELMPYLQGGKFCLSTVDSIFKKDEFKRYIRRFIEDDVNDALMGVTDYVDDEKPLYVKVDGDSLRITGYADNAFEGCHFISGGIYCMNQKALSLLPKAKYEGVKRMRGFQQYLVDAGLNVQAWPFSKVIDIDHATDIDKATQFLKE